MGYCNWAGMNEANTRWEILQMKITKQVLAAMMLIFCFSMPIVASAETTDAEDTACMYTIVKADGDVVWDSIPVFAIDQVLWTADVGVRASGQLCYDEENLYVHLAAVEKEIRAENTEPMSPVYEDSCLEFFFMLPDADNYINFEINPNG